MRIYQDPEQNAAITSKAANLLLTAPPGCGKTDVLARRAATLIPQLLPGQRILALTFSNKARENLRARLSEVLGTSALYRHMTVRNYHGHAMEVVRAHARTLGVPAHSMEHPSRKQLKELERRATQMRQPEPSQAAVRQALNELEDAKRAEFDDPTLLGYLELFAEKLTYQIEADRQQRGELHYGDLLRLAQLALGVETIAKLYQNHYGAVLVDEFQDLTPQQLEIVLRTCTTSRTFAGDQFQGIYSWAGARPIEVSDTLAALCTEHITLTRSYRSSPAVLEAVNAVAADLGATHRLRSHDPGPGPGLATRSRSRSPTSTLKHKLLLTWPNPSRPRSPRHQSGSSPGPTGAQGRSRLPWLLPRYQRPTGTPRWNPQKWHHSSTKPFRDTPHPPQSTRWLTSCWTNWQRKTRITDPTSRTPSTRYLGPVPPPSPQPCAPSGTWTMNDLSMPASTS